jgi:hypothetical protein
VTKRSRECAIEIVGEGHAVEMFVVFDGVRIAKRGHPDTSQARTWVSLEPGFAVYDDYNAIVIIKAGIRIQ